MKAPNAIVNVNSTATEPIVQFNGKSTPPTVVPIIQTKFESSPINNATEITIDNRHNDNMSNGTSSDAAYESSEER